MILMSKISIIAAVDRHMAIGFQNKLVFPSLESALQSCKENEHVYIIGGASIYRQALPFADELCLTEIDNTAPEADVYFPEVSPEIWQEKSREPHPADEKHLCSYAFVDYVRK